MYIIKDALTGYYWCQNRTSTTKQGYWSNKQSNVRVFAASHYTKSTLRELVKDKLRQPVLVEVQLVEVN
jgi:hypothetical protein